jgi:hypothetical protein
MPSATHIYTPQVTKRREMRAAKAISGTAVDMREMEK